MSEYTNANSITFSPSSGGNTAKVKALWDSQALYIGYEITDTEVSSPATTRDGSVWNDDSVELMIDTQNNDGGSATPNSSYMLPDDYHGIINTLNAVYDSQELPEAVPLPPGTAAGLQPFNLRPAATMWK